MLVYMCGAMTEYINRGEFDQARQWREDFGYKIVKAGINNDLNIKVFDPTANFDTNKHSSEDGVVIQNLHYLKQSDMLVVNGKYLLHSPGSIFEISHAWFNQKPIYIFGDYEYQRILHLRVMCTEYLDNMDEVVKRIVNLYNA